jgi:hypothetical protein
MKYLDKMHIKIKSGLAATFDLVLAHIFKPGLNLSLAGKSAQGITVGNSFCW